MKYILEGKKAVECGNIIEWGKWMESANRVVAQDKVGKVRVSTVFLGLDHSFVGGVPLLFETMVFGGKLNQEQRRYTTWEESEMGHKKMLKKIKE